MTASLSQPVAEKAVANVSVLTVARWIIGCVVLIAAGLKMRPAIEDLAYFRETLRQNEVLWILAAGLVLPLVEILIAVVIIRGPRGSRAQWCLAAATFAILLFAALFAYWNGETDCGCFGRLSVRPIQTIAFDAVVLLTCISGTVVQAENHTISARQLLRTVAFGSAMWGAFVLATGSLAVSKHHTIMPQSSIVVCNYPATVDLIPLQWFNASLTIRNVSDQEITIYGANESCGTRYDGNFPMCVKSGEIRQIAFHARTNQTAKRVRIPIWLYVGRDTGHRQFVAYRAVVRPTALPHR
ncbi:MAG: hypothetical protein L0211_00235 [Planctomycetaceae bacterium]|nr:hypothetical protein [Planctomycetaceae bacterium]